MVESTILAGDMARLGAALITAQREAVKQQNRAEAAERELTAMAARCGERDTFWVVERFKNGQSQGYWTGGSSRDFTREIDKAVQFRRKDDAFWTTRGWHWTDTKITEHKYLAEPLPARAAAMGAVVDALGKITSRHPLPNDLGGLMLGFDSMADRDKFCEACDALAKLDGAA